MAFLVCHMQKLGSGALGGIQSHNNRERESKTNPDIDYSKSDSNYSLVECRNYRQAIKANIDELNLKKAVRKDAVLACSFVITSSQDYFQDKTPEETKAFFSDTVKFFQDRYGEKNVIAAQVHLDETTPHMHLLVTPIRHEKLSAKAIFDRKELQSLQTDLHALVGRSRGLSRGKPGSDRAHLSENRFKAEKALEAAQLAEERQRQAEEKLETLEPHLLKAAEVEKIQGKKTLLGGLRGVSYAEYESLKTTAGRVDQAEHRAAAADRRADLAEQKAAKAKNETLQEFVKIQQEWHKLGDERAAVEAAMEKTPSKMLQAENSRLAAKNKKLSQALENLKKFVLRVADRLPEELRPEAKKLTRDALDAQLSKTRSSDRGGHGLGR